MPDQSGVSPWTYALFLVLGSVGMLVVALVNGNPLLLIAGGVFVLGSLGMGLAMFVTMRNRTQGQRFDSRSRWFDHLADARTRLAEAATTQRDAARAAHPEPASMAALVAAGERTWQRRPGDADFLHLRVGVGAVPALAAPGYREAEPTAALDPAAEDAARRLVEVAGTVEGVPVALPLRAGTTTIVGSAAAVRALARAVVAQLTTLHAPDDVRLAVAAPSAAAARAWEHTKWLPHVRHPSPEAGDGPEPLLLATSAGDLADLLGPELERRRRSSTQPNNPWSTLTSAAAAGPALVLLVDGPLTPVEAAAFADAPELGVALLVLVTDGAPEPSGVDVSVLVGDDGAVSFVERTPLPPLHASGSGALPAATSITADALSLADADATTRALAPLELSHEIGEFSLSDVSDLPGLLRIADVGALDPARVWPPRPERALLRVPLGVDVDGRPVELDLKESALDGMGPHGLVVGATGSGKSELLRTLVTGLALTHSPEDLALVLVDFKGGATFVDAVGLPHVAGSITDLEDDPDTVARMATALRGELRRRERLLRGVSLASIREHRQARLSGHRHDLPAMPHLLVIVDEFSELLTQEPEMIDLFVTVGRLGRSLGVHLLLATQRLEEGRLRGLDSHLSYRIALRTFSSAESRTVIGTADAYELPPVPGSAYLKVDTSVFQRLRVATVSSPYVTPGPAAVRSAPVAPRTFSGFGPGAGSPAPLPALGLDLSDPSQRSTMVVAADSLTSAASARGIARVDPVWLPPLPREVTLDRLVGPLVRVRGRGLSANGPVGALQVPLGVVDLPDRQAQQTFTLDLALEGGHVGVVGRPGSGKSVALAGLVTALAVTHTPAQVQVYCLDLGGGTLAPLAALPHVGGVAPRSQPDLMRRTVAQVGALLDARDRGEAQQARETQQAAGDGAGGGVQPHVVLVVDGWAVLRAEHEDLEAAVTGIATRGAAHRVHLVVASPRWMDLHPALKGAIGNRLEMRLGEASDSVFTRAAARALPSVPGRMLTAGDRRVQVALPRVRTGEEMLAPAALGAALHEAWDGPVAPTVRLLPTLLTRPELRAVELRAVGAGAVGAGTDAAAGAGALGSAGRQERGVAVGLRGSDLAPLRVDLLGDDPHLLVLGDARSGRTSALHTLVAAMTERWTPEELRVVVVDYRRGLLDAIDDAHLSQYCASAPAAAGVLGELFTKLAGRLPGPDVTREQLRAGTWWSGPRALVVVDDHDLVAAASGDPLSALLDLLPVARDVGLHLVVARPAGGVVSALSSPVLRRLRELGTPGLLLSGPGDEGPVLHRTRMRSLPPGRALWATRQGEAELVQLALPDA